MRFYTLLAIRIENGDLVFCIEHCDGEDYDADFKTVYVYESSYLSNYDLSNYVYKSSDRVIRCLEAYVRILSDETKSNISWKI